MGLQPNSPEFGRVAAGLGILANSATSYAFMPDHVVLLSVPGLRGEDLAAMPNLRRLVEGGDRTALVPSFPCVTCPVQVNMTTGKPPSQHGVVANGFYWRDKH